MYRRQRAVLFVLSLVAVVSLVSVGWRTPPERTVANKVVQRRDDRTFPDLASVLPPPPTTVRAAPQGAPAVPPQAPPPTPPSHQQSEAPPTPPLPQPRKEVPGGEAPNTPAVLVDREPPTDVVRPAGRKLLGMAPETHAFLLNATAFQSQVPSMRSRRVILWKHMPLAGMGNHLLSLISTIVFGALSNRGVVIQPNTPVHEAFNIISPYTISEAAMKVPPREAGSVSRTAVPDTWDPMLCDPLDTGGRSFPKSSLTGAGTVRLEGTQWYAAMFMVNPHTSKAVMGAFPNGRGLFTHTANFVLKPKPQISSAVKEFMGSVRDGQPISNAPVISIQHRPEHFVKQVREEHAMLACAEAVAGSLCTDMAEAGQLPPGRSVQDCMDATRFVVASIDKGFWSRVRAALGAARVAIATNAKSFPKQQAVVFDMLALGAADEMIITWPRSTFGTVAAGLAGKAPYAVVGSTDARRYNAQCVKLVSAEPCFHGWRGRFKSKCYDRDRFEIPALLNTDDCYMLRENDPVQLAK